MVKLVLFNFLLIILIEKSFEIDCGKSFDGTKLMIWHCNDTALYQNVTNDVDKRAVVFLDAGYKSNNFPVLNANFFTNKSRLEKVWLKVCNIQNITEDAFSELKNLSTLSLIYNKITEIPEHLFVELTNLINLDLSGNQLRELPPTLLAKNRNLEKLSLRENKINELPDGLFDSLEELVVLEMRSNEIEVLQADTFKHNRKLKELSLETNKIRAIPGRFFNDFVSLTELDLGNNSCIDKYYGKWNSQVLINMTEFANDFKVCNQNYELPDSSTSLSTISFIAETTTELPLKEDDLHYSEGSSTLILSIAAIVTILSVCGITFTIYFFLRAKQDHPEVEEMRRLNQVTNKIIRERPHNT
jgi:hypothetical protein